MLLTPVRNCWYKVNWTNWMEYEVQDFAQANENPVSSKGVVFISNGQPYLWMVCQRKQMSDSINIFQPFTNGPLKKNKTYPSGPIHWEIRRRNTQLQIPTLCVCKTSEN